MAAKLVAEEGSLKGLVLSLEDGDQWVIGRDPDACQLLIEDPATSRKHLVCRTSPQGIILENLSTSNPVQINDEEVKEPRLLQNGDSVKIGNGLFRFYAETAVQLFDDNPATHPSPLPTQSQEESQINAVKVNGEEVPTDSDQAAPIASEPQNQSAADAAPPLPESEPAPPPPAPPTEEDPQIAALPSEEEEEHEQKVELPSLPPSEHLPEDEERHDSIFEDSSDKGNIAEINFGVLETGRWLLKVVGGPNNGAEYSMHTGKSYVIGTDPNTCDIVFHDTSVSRQHARITIAEDNVVTIEDLKSRNGILIDGQPLKEKQTLTSNMFVSVGTSSFVVYDREGEMQTIISPLMPSLVKDLQNEEAKSSKETPEPPQPAPAPPEIAHPHTSFGAFILIGILTGLFVILGIGTSTLFKSEPIVHTQPIDPNKALDSILAPFPSVKYTFNTNSGQLLLVGHVLTSTDRSQLLYGLQGLNFIKSLDDSGIVIDEYVWREINQILENNPEWKGINIISSTPGHFVISGYLKTHSQAEHLSEYLNANFPYPDLLDKKIIVEEDIVSSVNALLQSKGINNVVVKFDNGDLVLTGGIPGSKEKDLDSLMDEIKEVRGVRAVRNLTVTQAQEKSMINISDKYEVSGMSNQSGKLSVVINGRILMKGDILDGMTITQIDQNGVLLEKDGIHYRIDINH